MLSAVIGSVSGKAKMVTVKAVQATAMEGMTVPRMPGSLNGPGWKSTSGWLRKMSLHAIGTAYDVSRAMLRASERA